MTYDPTEFQIAQNVCDTLSAITLDGKALFTKVQIIDDPMEFLGVADAMNKRQAGVVLGPSARGRSMDNAQSFVYRLPLSVIIPFGQATTLGGMNATRAMEVNKIAEVVREAVMADRGRDGRARRIMWGNQMIDQTDVYAEPKMLKRNANIGDGVHVTYMGLLVPVVCGLARDAF